MHRKPGSFAEKNVKHAADLDFGPAYCIREDRHFRITALEHRAEQWRRASLGWVSPGAVRPPSDATGTENVRQHITGP